MIAPETFWWICFIAFVLAMLALDLGVFNRDAHEVKMREALTWTGVWFTLSLLLGVGIYVGWIGSYAADLRHNAAVEYLTGYLIEVSLSVDNVFVFALLFNYFHVPPLYRHRVLFWGIPGALVMRAAMIFAGVALLHAFHWVIYIFAMILIYAGIKMWRSHAVTTTRTNNPGLRMARRILPVADADHGPRFLVRQNGALAVTPRFIVLVLVEWTDLVFAVDSIPAVLAVPGDPCSVCTSKVMGVMGRRAHHCASASKRASSSRHPTG